VLLERLPLLGQALREVVEVHPTLSELLLQVLDVVQRGRIVRLALVVCLFLCRELAAQSFVLPHFLVPLLLRIAAAGAAEREAEGKPEGHVAHGRSIHWERLLGTARRPGRTLVCGLSRSCPIASSRKKYRGFRAGRHEGCCAPA